MKQMYLCKFDRTNLKASCGEKPTGTYKCFGFYCFFFSENPWKTIPSLSNDVFYITRVNYAEYGSKLSKDRVATFFKEKPNDPYLTPKSAKT